MVTSEKHQKSLLGGIERLAGETYPSLIPNGVPKIIMAFYQADVLEEEVIKQWGTHVSKKVSRTFPVTSLPQAHVKLRAVRGQGDVEKGPPRLRARPQVARRGRGRIVRGGMKVVRVCECSRPATALQRHRLAFAITSRIYRSPVVRHALREGPLDDLRCMRCQVYKECTGRAGSRFTQLQGVRLGADLGPRRLPARTADETWGARPEAVLSRESAALGSRGRLRTHDERP